MHKAFLLIEFFLFLFSSVNIAQSENGIPYFVVHYGIVKHTLKGDVGKFDELIELMELDRDAANQLSEFWWHRAIKSCLIEVDSAINKYIGKEPEIATEQQKKKRHKAIIEEITPCINSYIYGNRQINPIFTS